MSDITPPKNGSTTENPIEIKEEKVDISSNDLLTSGKRLPVQNTLERFLASIRGIDQTARIALPHISKWTFSEREKTKKKIEKFIPDLSEGGDGPKSFSLESAREFAEFTSTIRQMKELGEQKSTLVLAKSLFTQLFAEFDAYIGDLLKVIYLKNDRLLKGISREISLSDLLEFEDLNAVKISMLEKEIETIRRDSYIEQFSTLENKFNLQLKKFNEWSDFVELSQRRNILIHNGGVVSDQYLTICDRESYKFQSRPNVGDKLGVTFPYFIKATRLISKVGLMLAYTLWMKVFPKECSDIHEALNRCIFQCLEQERWELVAELNDFILSEPMRRGLTEIDLRIRVINTSIGLKFSGKDEDSKKLLDSFDWSASYRDFRLAIAVLKDDYKEAVKIMRSIGKNGEMISQESYHTWPLFTRFRERPEFYDEYLVIYGEVFSEQVETTKGAIEAQAKPSDEKLPHHHDIKINENISPKPNTTQQKNKEVVKAAKPALKTKSIRKKSAL